MGKSIEEIAEQLINTNKKVQLIYAFNGTGKTRLSRTIKELIIPKQEHDSEESELSRTKFIYYNAFTEDLFYWDNDLNLDIEFKLKIQENSFVNWIIKDQGQDQNIITHFQRYNNKNITPAFYLENNYISFDYASGDKNTQKNIKVSKGEESIFIWCIFYSLLEQVIEVLQEPEINERSNDEFNELKFIVIDDPVSSLDENHLIEQAVDISKIIKSSTNLKFIITTHNPLFFNILYNELTGAEKYILNKFEDGEYELISQKSDSPFSYHLHLKQLIEYAISSDQLEKYHFNFLRNILEKTSTFLGYQKWGELLPKNLNGGPNPYETRIINLSSHSKQSSEEVTFLTENDKRVLKFLMKKIHEMYHFK